MKKTSLCLMILPTLAASPSAFCEDALLEELRQRCQEARQSKIAPLREAAIEECVSSDRSGRTREDCERLNEGFGEGAGSRPGMFLDLPECVEYFDAQDRQRTTDRSRR